MKNPITPTKPNPNQSADLAALVKEAKRLGVHSFIFLYKPDETTNTVHIQDCRFKDALDLIISAFQFALQSETKNHPEYSAEYRAIFVDLLSGFNQLLQDANLKFANLNKKPYKV